jgi:tRNA-dihydrouridine synthase C
VFWKPIGRVRERLRLPVVANGDIWTLADFRRCREESGAIHFMLGRGALADPLLVHRVAAELGLPHAAPRAVAWVPLLRKLEDRAARFNRGPNRVLFRLKQWLSTAAKAGAFAHFDAVKRAESCADLFAALEAAEGGALTHLSHSAG